jgi:hypothetical protein
MAVINILKISIWVVGGLFLAGICGVLVLYVAAGLAMAGNSRAMEKQAAAREAAFKALTPAEHLAEAKLALDQEVFYVCEAHLHAVPTEAPGRAELWDAMIRRKAEHEAAEAAFQALPVAEHLKAAEAALDAKDFPTCRHHLLSVPPETPGAEALIERRRIEEDAWDQAQDAARASNPLNEVSR